MVGTEAREVSLIPSSRGSSFLKSDKQLFREAQNSWLQAQFLWDSEDSERAERTRRLKALGGKIRSLT